MSSLLESQNYAVHSLDAKVLQICGLSKSGSKDNIKNFLQLKTNIKMSTKIHSVTFITKKISVLGELPWDSEFYKSDCREKIILPRLIQMI